MKHNFTVSIYSDNGILIGEYKSQSKDCRNAIINVLANARPNIVQGDKIECR